MYVFEPPGRQPQIAKTLSRLVRAQNESPNSSGPSMQQEHAKVNKVPHRLCPDPIAGLPQRKGSCLEVLSLTPFIPNLLSSRVVNPWTVSYLGCLPGFGEMARMHEA